MLTPEQVIPFLMHEEAFVRRQAATYLTEAHDPSPATAEDVWRAIGKYGMWGPEGLVGDLHGLPQTEASLWRAMGALSGTLDQRTREYLEDAVESVGWPLLEQFREELLAGLQLSEESKGYLRRRLELASRGGAELWEELMKLGVETGSEWPDEGEVEALVEAIARRGGEGVIGNAMEVLRDKNVTDWREVFAVDVVGAARHEPAVDLLLEKMRADDDVMPERVVDALVRIGTAEVVRKVEAFLPKEEWGTRLSGIDVLGRIKRPESEAALLRLLETEKDKELATWIGESLCLLCAPASVLGMLRDRVAVGRLGEVFGHDLEGMILAAGRMVGYLPPENKKWTDRARRMDEKMVELREEMDRGEYDEAEDEGGIYEVEGPADVPPPANVSGFEEVTWPIHREGPKVGRNDPCPCGSGKKYKKCCGKE